MALNPETIVWARIGVSDMLLTAYGGRCCPFSGMPSRQNQWYKRVISCFYVLIALCCFDKGIVLPALIIGLFLPLPCNAYSFAGDARLVFSVLAIALPCMS